jgi:nitrogenase subunit NifH
MKNRNQLIEAFVSNLSNAIVHQILETAIDQQEISQKYVKEFKNSWQIAKIYRGKINPANRSLPVQDIEEIKRKITNNVNSELKLRIEKGYENIDLSLVLEFVDKALKELNVI